MEQDFEVLVGQFLIILRVVLVNHLLELGKVLIHLVLHVLGEVTVHCLRGHLSVLKGDTGDSFHQGSHVINTGKTQVKDLNLRGSIVVPTIFGDVNEDVTTVHVVVCNTSLMDGCTSTPDFTLSEVDTFLVADVHLDVTQVETFRHGHSETTLGTLDGIEEGKTIEIIGVGFGVCQGTFTFSLRHKGFTELGVDQVRGELVVHQDVKCLQFLFTNLTILDYVLTIGGLIDATEGTLTQFFTQGVIRQVILRVETVLLRHGVEFIDLLTVFRNLVQFLALEPQPNRLFPGVQGFGMFALFGTILIGYCTTHVLQNVVTGLWSALCHDILSRLEVSPPVSGDGLLTGNHVDDVTTGHLRWVGEVTLLLIGSGYQLVTPCKSPKFSLSIEPTSMTIRGQSHSFRLLCRGLSVLGELDCLSLELVEGEVLVVVTIRTSGPLRTVSLLNEDVLLYFLRTVDGVVTIVTRFPGTITFLFRCLLFTRLDLTLLDFGLLCLLTSLHHLVEGTTLLFLRCLLFFLPFPTLDGYQSVTRRTGNDVTGRIRPVTETFILQTFGKSFLMGFRLSPFHQLLQIHHLPSLLLT